MATETNAKRKTGPAPQEGRPEEWLRPLEPGDDTSGWATHPMPEDHARGPRGSIFAVDLDAEQTAWLYARAEAAGVTPIDYLKALVEAARAAEHG